MPEDLSPAHLAHAMPGRSVRSYPALLSTEADAMAWARAGAPSGAVVVADYQAAPRGRGGLPWYTAPGAGLSFSIVLRPDLPPTREGWCYIAGLLALTDAIAGTDVVIEWPDRVARRGTRHPLASLGTHVQLGLSGTDWAVINVLIHDAQGPRDALLARCVVAIEARLNEEQETVLEEYRSRCATLGQRVQARLVPLGPNGVRVLGEGLDVLDDGALVIRTDEGRRVAVRPQDLGLLEDADESD
ncbi:MAG: biotin--[acetyl-CoA-carboxylase] ligase [Nocardioidaceae bacterium]